MPRNIDHGYSISGISVHLGSNSPTELTAVFTGKKGNELDRKTKIYDPDTCSLKDA